MIGGSVYQHLLRKPQFAAVSPALFLLDTHPSCVWTYLLSESKGVRAIILWFVLDKAVKDKARIETLVHYRSRRVDFMVSPQLDKRYIANVIFPVASWGEGCCWLGQLQYRPSSQHWPCRPLIRYLFAGACLAIELNITDSRWLLFAREIWLNVHNWRLNGMPFLCGTLGHKFPWIVETNSKGEQVAKSMFDQSSICKEERAHGPSLGTSAAAPSDTRSPIRSTGMCLTRITKSADWVTAVS